MRSKILGIYCVAIILGLLTGLAGSLLILGTNLVIHWLAVGYAYANTHGYPAAAISALVSMSMIYTAWLMVRCVAPEASGSGVQEIEGVLAHSRPIRWRRLLPVKFFGGILSISSNLVVGREGPTIQIGGNLGAMLAEWFHLSIHRRDALIASGAGAGLAVAFNAPLAGILFVLEEMRSEFHFSFTNFTAVTVCCVMSTIVLHLIVGPAPDISMAVFSLPSLRSLLLFFIFGLVIGVVGLVFNIVLMKVIHLVDQLSFLMRDVYVILVGLLVGFLVYTHPEFVGGGYVILEKSLTMTPTLSVLVVVIFVRFIMTMLSYNTGVPGGIFAPMLALGTLLGLAASHVLQWMMLDITVHPGMFAVAGMGALFAAVVRAPVTGIILVVEMTQNYLLILPLMVTCLTATLVVQLSGNKPIYTQLLRHTLQKQEAQEGVLANNE